MIHPLPTFIFMPFFVIYFAIRIYWGVKAEKRPVQEKKSFFLDKLNICLMNFFLVIFPMLSLFTPLLNDFDYPENEILICLSIPFLVLGLITIWLSHRDLGENWSVTLELKQGHSLITKGIYRTIRHPMYLSIWLCSIGQALCIPNYLGGLGVLIVWGLLYFVRIDREERMMLEKFGEEYRSYISKTGRLLPRIPRS